MSSFEDPAERAAPPLPFFAVALCLLAAVLLGAAGMSKRWLGNEGARATVVYGLIRNIECREGECVSRPNRELPVLLQRHPPEPLSPVFVPAGYVTLGASAVAILSLAIAALAALARARVRLPLTPPNLALLALTVALVGGALFIVAKPGGRAVVGVDWAFAAFGAALVAGIAGAQKLAAVGRALDE